MKRCLALALCLMMLALPAMAEGEGAYLKIYDPQLYSNDELVLDLTGVELELGAGASDAELSLWAQLAAGDASLKAAAALTETNVSAYLSGMANVYKLSLADLGLDAETINAALETVDIPDPTAILDEFNAAIEELQPQMDAVLENAVVEENVEWPMYDGDHMTTKTTVTIPSELLRGYFEAGYDLVMDLMEQYGDMAAEMGADVNLSETGDMDEFFATNPYIDVEIYQANDSGEFVSMAIYLMSDEETMPVYVDLYMPVDGNCVYIYVPIEETSYLEVLFDIYDDGYVYFQIAATENNESVFDINYTKGMDETEEFLVQEFNLNAEDLVLSVYDHNDNATEHYLEIVANAEDTEVVFELLTNPTEDGAAGYIALSTAGVSIVANVEYGLTDEIVSLEGVGIETVDALTLSEEDIEAVGEEAANVLLGFLMQAMEEIPALQTIMGE